MDISPSQVEAGDFLFIVRSDISEAVTGFVLRHLTSAEVTSQANNPATCTGGVWLSVPSVSGFVFGPSEVFVLLAVVKSHKVVADDLGPYLGLADG